MAIGISLTVENANCKLAVKLFAEDFSFRSCFLLISLEYLTSVKISFFGL